MQNRKQKLILHITKYMYYRGMDNSDKEFA